MREGLIRIDPGLTKGGEGRQFPLTNDLRKILQRRQRAKVEGRALVFHIDGQPIHRRRFHSVWTAACTAAKVEGRIPHDMRRSAVRNLERAGINAALLILKRERPATTSTQPAPVDFSVSSSAVTSRAIS